MSKANQFILTPFFLDNLVPELQPYLAPGWSIVQPELSDADDVMGRLVTTNRDIALHVKGALDGGKRPVSVAGDCVASLGMVAGLQQAGQAPVLIWFDAHGDFNTPETSPSGFLGGMPLAMLVGRGNQTIMQGLGVNPLAESTVILTDARDLDPLEAEAVAQSGVVHLKDVRDLLTYDLPDAPIYVHFDADVLDPNDAPAHRYVAAGGASVETMRAVFGHLAKTGRVMAVSVSSWDAANDADGKTGAVCMGLLDVLLG